MKNTHIIHIILGIFLMMGMMVMQSFASSVVYNVIVSNSITSANILSNTINASSNQIYVNGNLTSVIIPLSSSVFNGTNVISSSNGNLTLTINTFLLESQIINLTNLNIKLKAQLMSNQTLLVNATNTILDLRNFVSTENSFLAKHNGILSFGNSIVNSTYGINIISPILPKINQVIVLTPSWSANVYYNNSEYNLTIVANEINKLGMNKSLQIGSIYSNSTYGLRFNVEPFNSNLINNSVLTAYYNSNIGNNCAEYINLTDNTSNGLVTKSICAKTKNQSSESIFDVCIGDKVLGGNITQGFGQCVIQFAAQANQTARSLSEQLTQANAKIANLTVLNNQLETGANQASGFSNAVSGIIQDGTYIVLITLLVFAYLRRPNRGASHTGVKPQK